MSKSNSSETTEEQQEALDRQPFMAHLIEFRDRVLRIFISILVIFAGLFSFSQDLYLYVSEPIREFLPESSTMIATEVASPFLTPFKLTLVLSMFAAMPYILYQIWAFVAPGLYQREKKIVLPLFFFQRVFILWRHGLCVLCGIPSGVYVFYQHCTGRHQRDARYSQLFRLCAEAVFCLRTQL